MGWLQEKLDGANLSRGSGHRMEVNKTAGLARKEAGERCRGCGGSESRARLLNNVWPCKGTDSSG